MTSSRFRTPPLDPVRLLVLGAGCTAALAVASWSVAGVSVHTRPGLTALAWPLYYAGLLGFLAAWLGLGLHVRAGTVRAGAVRRFALATGAPLLGAAPFGRDLWAYAAQGQVTARGLDPYSVGPSAVPGRFADEVSLRWIDTPSPYGPVWLRLSQLADRLAADHPTVAALLLRLPALVGVALICWALVVLARRFGLDAATALWLGPACPLMIVLGVGGGHNDLLALALAVAGLALATRPGPRWLVLGSALIGLAVMVKSPALVALAFVVPLWLHAQASSRLHPVAVTPRRLVATCAGALASAAAVLAALAAVCGLGWGWTAQVGADASWTSTLSVPTGAGMLGRLLTGQSPVRRVEGLIHTTRTVGEVLAVLAIAALWALAVSRLLAGRAAPGEHATSRHPLAVFAGAMATAVLLAPAVQPWYFLWAIVPAALAVRRHRSFLGLALAGLLFPIMIMPSGTGWESDLRFPAVVLAAAGVVLAVFGRRSAATSATSSPDEQQWVGV